MGYSPIGIFDSGYGGLTIMREITAALPQYDYLYLGDNARAPYGSRSFELVYEFTLQAVNHLFDQGCNLIILACNTASAKALRTIQQKYLPVSGTRRVLGVIRPTVETLGNLSATGHIGVLGTPGTIASHSYELECAKLYPDFKVYGQECPLWVPLIENREHNSPGADYFVEKYISQLLQQSSDIDTVVLGCTHYPLLIDKIRAQMPPHINIVLQGDIVASALSNYLSRHHELESTISRGGTQCFLTTENANKFNSTASIFMLSQITAEHITL